MRVVCPGCGEKQDVGAKVQVGDVVSCASCAGVLFRLTRQNGQYVLHEVPQASCPQCETLVQLPDGIRPGETFRHCDRTFVVTYAYGAYALEPVGESECTGQREARHASPPTGITQEVVEGGERDAKAAENW